MEDMEDEAELSIMICLTSGEPDIQINDTFSFVSFGEFAKSPMLSKLSREQRRLWEAQLRDLIVQLRMLSLTETKASSGQ